MTDDKPLSPVDNLAASYFEGLKQKSEGVIQKLKRDMGFQATSTKSRDTDFKPRVFKSKKEAEKDFIEFVGFRGYYEKGHPVIDVSHTYEEIEIIDPNTGEVIEIERKYNFNHKKHKGKAHPAPIDEKNVFWGILPHEVEAFHEIRRYLVTGIMFKWPRGAGKTYVACWFIEWSMSRLGYPWLYLSETAIMNDVAFWIWTWANNTKQVRNSQKGDKQNTYTQFELYNGAVLRIYRYLDEKSVGQHGWYLAFDDIVKRAWEDRPSEVKKAKMQWTYSLSNIKRKGLMVFGTRKFMGDPLEFLEKVIPVMYINVKTPYIMEGVFPDWTIQYDSEGKEILWCPELYTHESLDERKITPTDDDVDPMEAFKAEMMQDPRALGGRMVSPDDIMYRRRPFHSETIMVGIGVDLSWADTNDSSDMCGIVSCIMHSETIEKIEYKRFTMIKTDVRRMPLYDEVRDEKYRKGVFTVIEEHFRFLSLNYPRIPLIIAIERNSGGMIIIKVAQREKFKWIRKCVTDKKEAFKWDKEGNTNIPIGITHKKNKIARVYGELQNSIKAHKEWGINKEGFPCHQMQFDNMLDGTEFMKQLVRFPKYRHDDGPDSAGMIKDELNRRWTPKRIKVPRQIKKQEKIIKRAQEKFEQLGQPWLADQKKLRRRNRVK